MIKMNKDKQDSLVKGVITLVIVLLLSGLILLKDLGAIQ